MRRFGLLLVLLVLSSGAVTRAYAGAYADQLAACLMDATTPADQKIVVRWAFATLALDPDVATMATVTPAERDTINRAAGDLVTRLLTDRCRQPVQQTLAVEGVAGVQAAFTAWGRHAITGLGTEPHVAGGMAALLQYLDLGKLLSLMPLGGLPPVPAGTH